MELTLEKFKAAYPDLFKQIDAEAYARGLADGTAQGTQAGVAQGAEKERSRIKDVEAQSLPGHENLIASLKYDGKTTGPEAAIQVLAAERTVAQVRSDTFQKEHVKVVAAAEPADKETGKEMPAEGGSATEDQLKASWDKNPAVRAEFGDNYEAYLAFEKAKAKGLVKIYEGNKKEE